LKEIIAKYGPDSVGMLCSGKILNGEYPYVLISGRLQEHFNAGEMS
jgi:anaerobic selenocysteine-containing dehydrogenase